MSSDIKIYISDGKGGAIQELPVIKGKLSPEDQARLRELVQAARERAKGKKS